MNRQKNVRAVFTNTSISTSHSSKAACLDQLNQYRNTVHREGGMHGKIQANILLFKKKLWFWLHKDSKNPSPRIWARHPCPVPKFQVVHKNWLIRTQSVTNCPAADTSSFYPDSCITITSQQHVFARPNICLHTTKQEFGRLCVTAPAGCACHSNAGLEKVRK